MELLIESNFNTNIVLDESVETAKKKMYIEGIFLQADTVNRNRRVYPTSIMENAVHTYKETYMKRNMGVGELDHPQGMAINSDRIACRITEITQDGKNFMGKALLLETPMGLIARSLIEGGIQLGVSSRAMGSVKKNKSGINEVQHDLMFKAVDIVTEPSGIDCYVNGILESYTPIWNSIEEIGDANLVEDYKKEILTYSADQISENKMEIFKNFIEIITRKG
jgi:hypothetical protein